MDAIRRVAIEKYLDMWARYMSNDASVLRQELWFKDRSIGTYERLTLDRDADEEIDSRALEVMKGALASLTPNQRIAVELDQGLRTVADITNHAAYLEEALQEIWQTLVAHGVLVEI